MFIYVVLDVHAIARQFNGNLDKGVSNDSEYKNSGGVTKTSCCQSF